VDGRERPIVVRSGTAAIVEWRPGVRTRLHRDEDAPPSSLCMFEQWCDPGTGAPEHTHFETEEIVAVIEGAAEFWVGAERTELGVGESVLLPPHSWHGFRNSGSTTLHLFAVLGSARPLVQYRDSPVALEIVR
jgi:mannose-6-phosphate isomerase-like protein (cupin superfamily)